MRTYIIVSTIVFFAVPTSASVSGETLKTGYFALIPNFGSGAEEVIAGCHTDSLSEIDRDEQDIQDN